MEDAQTFWLFLDQLLQAPIFLFGVLYMWFYSCKEIKWIRIGHWIVVCIQPAWWFTTAFHQQWGVFALSVIYFFIGLRGLRNTNCPKEEWNDADIEVNHQPDLV